MKLNKHKLFSALFLFIFISAFSSGIYDSLSDSYRTLSHFSIKKEVKEDNNVSSSSDALVFEETENDSEESTNPALILLPDFYSFNILNSFSKTNFSELSFSEKASDPIFLSIRVLRI